MWKRLPIVLVLASSAASAQVQDETCKRLLAVLPQLQAGTEVRTNGTGRSYKSLFDECDAHDTFTGRPLPMHAGRRLTCADRNNVSTIVRRKDGTIFFSAKAAVDADGSRLACGTGWPNQCGTWLQFDKGSKRRDVNAEDTPFVVVPGPPPGNAFNFRRDTGIGPGDLAVAFKGSRCSFGVVGDLGPYFRLGEVSLRSHADLDHQRCKVPGQHPCAGIHDSGIGEGVNYLVFPHSRPAPLLSQTAQDVAQAKLRKRIAELLATLAH